MMRLLREAIRYGMNYRKITGLTLDELEAAVVRKRKVVGKLHLNNPKYTQQTI